MNSEPQILRIGTASWGIPTVLRENFPSADSLLERYAQVFNFVEINSSFYRSHQQKTYAKWAAATPADFRFSVKMPKEITHQHRLIDIDILLNQFLEEISGLQDKLGPILIQLPPSLDFKQTIANDFFKSLRLKFDGYVALEARHASWEHSAVVDILIENNIISVFADPAVIAIKSYENQPFRYYRLHGSPQIYASCYAAPFLDKLSKTINHSSWVVFDNTMLGAATQNALELKTKSSLTSNRQI